MATNANIGYIENDTITYTYLHYDGYPEHVGKMLYEEHNTTDKVKELVGLGYLESIDKDEVISFHEDKGYDFDEVSPQKKQIHLIDLLNVNLTIYLILKLKNGDSIQI